MRLCHSVPITCSGILYTTLYIYGMVINELVVSNPIYFQAHGSDDYQAGGLEVSESV